VGINAQWGDGLLSLYVIVGSLDAWLQGGDVEFGSVYNGY